MVLRTGELAALRAAFAPWLTVTAAIYRRTQVTDNAGGSTDTYASVGLEPCSFSSYPITPVERETTTRVQVIVYWRFLFEHDVDLRSTDYIVVVESSRQFQVVYAGAGSVAIRKEAICQEIT
jgi:hypothetical protein